MPFAARALGPVRRALAADVVPDPGGLVSFAALLLAVCGFLAAVPGPGGFSAPVVGMVPAGLRGPGADVLLEAFVQATLLVLPPSAAWAGVRHLSRRGDSLVPYLTVAGGAGITGLTGIGLVWTVW
jgi:hypothetical protein